MTKKGWMKKFNDERGRLFYLGENITTTTKKRNMSMGIHIIAWKETNGMKINYGALKRISTVHKPYSFSSILIRFYWDKPMWLVCTYCSSFCADLKKSILLGRSCQTPVSPVRKFFKMGLTRAEFWESRSPLKCILFATTQEKRCSAPFGLMGFDWLSMETKLQIIYSKSDQRFN